MRLLPQRTTMPPLPSTGAPTSGLPGLFYWGLVGFAFLLLALRYFLPSGKDRLQFRGKKEDDAIGILQAQIKTMAIDMRGLKLEVRRLVKNEEGNKEYRHAL